ncbi:MAG TPA: SpoIID/LytB domain-containing protein [Candidatus Sulfotelmatobacter sp.]|jgi:stage II sporulation protein D
MNRSNRFPLLGIVMLALLISTRHCVTSSPAFAGSAGNSAQIADLHIGVLGLFHPQEFEIQPVVGQALMLNGGGEAIVIESSSAIGSVALHRSNGRVCIAAGARTMQAASVMIGGRDGNATDFVLTIPGRISRRYHGALEIRPSGQDLLAILSMDRESAVASVVAAESDPDTPIEALKAQAIATRSYLVAARGRHPDFDFCDTTHCQFLREPPPAGSPAASAAAATSGLVIAYDSRPVAAMYSRSCSGRTRTPAQLGLPSSGYPYYSVECQHCRRHPQLWRSRIPIEETLPALGSDEMARLEIDRKLGWNAVPGNDFTARRQSGEVVLSGAGYGHGIGLCQSGAKAMAQAGASFREILNHYYPNTNIVNFRIH